MKELIKKNIKPETALIIIIVVSVILIIVTSTIILLSNDNRATINNDNESLLYILPSVNNRATLNNDNDNGVSTDLEQIENDARKLLIQKVNERAKSNKKGKVTIGEIITGLQAKGYIIQSDDTSTISSNNIKLKLNGTDIENKLVLSPSENKDVDVIINLKDEAKYYVINDKKSYEIQVNNGNITIRREPTKRKILSENIIPMVKDVKIADSAVASAKINNGRIMITAGTPGESNMTIILSNDLTKDIVVRVQFNGIEKDGKKFTWDEIDEFSSHVRADQNINNDSDTAGPYNINGKQLTLAVGDQGKVLDDTGKAYDVRILGFKADDLADGSGKAGISFEFLSSMGNYYINSVNTNEKGWATTDLRAVLNGGKKHDGATEVSDEDAKVNKLSNAKNIKLVKKKYIPVYNKDSTLTCNDKLWLLASGEIWNNGYKSGARGVAITDESTEAEQYRFYKVNLNNTAYNISTNVTKKPNAVTPVWWWLRSPLYGNPYTWCYVHKDGFGSSSGYSSVRGAVFPGFCI